MVLDTREEKRRRFVDACLKALHEATSERIRENASLTEEERAQAIRDNKATINLICNRTVLQD